MNDINGVKLKVGQKVKGLVTKLNPFGAFVQIDDDIHGLVHLSKMTAEDGKNKELKIEESYDFEIISFLLNTNNHLPMPITKNQISSVSIDSNNY